MSKDQRVDFFLSYTALDVAWAEWAAGVLEEAGFSTILQAWDFRPGSNFVLDMDRALRLSDRVMLMLSPAYLKSPFAATEWAASFLTDPTGAEGRLLPIRVAECEVDGLLAGVVYVDLVGCDEGEAQRRLLAGVKRERSKPAVSSAFPGGPVRPVRPFPGVLPRIWNVPARNPNFAGRDAELDRLRETLSAPGVAVAVLAISGLSGVGKSQLAIEHAWRRTTDYDLVWWVPAEELVSVPRSLGSLAERLGLRTDDSAEVVEVLHHELRQRDRWLVIFDNADEPAALAPYLPTGGGGQVLITSPNPAWRARAATLEMDVLAPTDAVALLLRRTGRDDERAAASIAHELGYLPLALDQAAAYLEETGMAMEAYRDLLHSRLGDLMELGSSPFYRRTVAATLGLAYERVVHDAPSAAEVLGTAAFLAAEDIPTELVSAAADPLAAEATFAALRRLSLIRRQGDSIAVHRLVGIVVRDHLGREERTGRARAATIALKAAALPVPADEPRSWPVFARLLPHVLALAEHPESAGTDLATLLAQAGVYLRFRGQLAPALEVLERALDIFEDAYGPDHPEVAGTLGNLGTVFRDLGDPDGARDHLERALGIFEATYGPDHPDVARTLTNLGLTLRDVGETHTARDCLQRALRIIEDAYGPDHPEMGATLVNLATVLRDLGDVHSSMASLKRALEIFEATYGPDHPDVARTLTNLAGLLRDASDLKAAKEHLQRALRTKEPAYGPDHPEVAGTLVNLGAVLRDLGDPDGARDHLERALGIFEATYGPGHPDVARTLTNLGMALRDLGDSEKARDCLQRALRIKETAYGPNHSEVAHTLRNLGLLLRDLGDPDGARNHLERASKIFEDAYGRDHPDVARVLSNLGMALRDLGDSEKARDCLQRALRIDEVVYGPNHPEVARALGNLGMLLRGLGELDPAKDHLQRALAMFDAAYLPDHPDVARTLGNLAPVLRDLGDLGGARDCLQRELRIEESVHGPEHPDVARTLGNLGMCLRSLGDLDGARVHLQRGLRIFEAVYGLDHPDTRRMRSVLATL